MSQTPSSFTPTPYTPSGDASFTPTQGTYKELKPFRYWCQKVLPLVYDDSLSYYELLCKVVDYLNKTMEDVDTLHDDVDNLHTAYTELETDMNNKYHSMTQWMNSSYTALVNFVNTYFANLDVQEEINNKLDDMASDGSLSALIEPYVQPAVNTKISNMVSSGQFADIVSPFVPPAVNTKVNNMVSDGSFKNITDPKVVQATDAWLGEHISNPSNPPLDTSMTLTNAAAQSKAVGDLISRCIKGISGSSYDYTTLPDANNAPVNSVIGIYNTEATDIAHLPSQAGTLLTADNYDTVGNFTFQLFIDENSKLYHRIYLSNQWGSWRETLTSEFKDAVVKCISSTYSYTNMSDANNAPVNSIIAVYNDEASQIEHLPEQIGTLITAQYANTNGNFYIQLFIDRYNRLHNRIKLANSWSSWYKTVITDDISTCVMGYPTIITYSEVQDANNLTVNRIYAILNEGTEIAHLPIQIGILVCERYTQSGGNFAYQKFIDSNMHCYIRAMYGNAWTNWIKQLSEIDLPRLLYCPSGAAYGYSTLPDANNAPVNSIIAVYNDTPNEIANIPEQIGTLITAQYNAQNANYNTQIFVDRYNRLYNRIKMGGSWSSWYKNVTTGDINTVVMGYPTLVDYSVVEDADNLTPNRIYAIYNDSANNIAHLPTQSGILIYERYQQSSGNFGYQKFIDGNLNTYIRCYFANAWTAWNKLLSDKDTPRLMHCPANGTYGYSDLPDANNAPVNTIIAIYNDTINNIANVPNQIGTLITMQYAGTNGNFNTQFFIDKNNTFYHRTKLGGLWRDWVAPTTKKAHNFYGKKIVLGGDSVTHGVGGTGFAQDGGLIITVADRSWYRNPNGYCWANLFESLLENKYNATVINNGCTGTNSGFWIDHLADLVPTDTDYFILTIGANDRDRATLADARTAILNNISAINFYCRRYNIKLLVFSPVTATLANETEKATQMWQINEFLKEVCSNENIEYYDLQNECYKFYFNKGQSIGTYSDASHPDDDMYYNMFFMYCWLLDICPALPVLTPPA